MEKSQPVATITEFPAAESHHYVWRTGVRRIPWSAFFALFVTLLCVPIAAAILVISNGHIADWKVQPSVLLGLVHGIGNAGLVYTLWKGVDITWWRAALHGTTLEQLNRIWFSGTSIKSALFSVHHVTKIGIASILCTIAGIVVSPLLQKASHSTLVDLAQEVEMQIYLPKQLPTGFVGVAWDSDSPSLPGNTLLTPGFLLAIQDYWMGAPILTLPDEGFFCDGTCRGTVEGAGISQSCSSSTATVDITEIDTSGFLGFGTSFLRYEGTDGVTYLQVTSQYISAVDNTCTATYVKEICDIRLGVNTYPLLYKNQTYTLDTPIAETVVAEYITTDDRPNAPFESPAGLLSGLHWFADTYLASNSTIVHGTDPKGRDTYIEIPSGYLSSQMLNLTNEFNLDVLNCQFEWKSPTVNITTALNTVAFNAAQMAGWARNESDLQSFFATQTNPTIIYHSEYLFLGIAVVLQLLALSTVTATLYGFWQIGHETSLSPLETGRALHPPILADGTSTHSLKGLLKEVGGRGVKYGVVAANGRDGNEVYKLGIGPPHLLVRHFRKG
ncbi:hypothetical protein N431DRAFT_529843 [Stipitochalara longipes BDJ]|nr:hypothetical protein N431DRAFT_529843 [Stipitochalara longipes BDJ]